MLAFGCSIIMPEIYGRCARPGIERACEADSVVVANAASGSIARSYNLLLDGLADLPDLEAVVLLHEDAEILEPDFCTKLRQAFADPEVAVVGCVGAAGVRDIAWWEGSTVWNSAPYRYGESGGGELVFGGPGGSTAAPGEVDSLYGVLLAFSPWAAQNLRFDESIGMLHGYDFDICRQARIQGRRVMTADLRLAHHHSLDLVSDIEIWVAAHMRASDLCDEDEPSSDEDWRPRARRAEASAAAARLLAASKLLQADASSRQSAAELDLVRNSLSWRITEPLRRGNALVRSVRAGRAKS
ncbi:MAG: glycosyltransferase [Solirubrobacteraceae bacterium]